MGKNATAKVIETTPALTVVKSPKVKTFDSYSVKVYKSVEFDAIDAIRHVAESLKLPFAVKTLKSGKVSMVVGKTSAGRPKMTEAEKTAVSQYRRLIHSNPATAALVTKLLESSNITNEKRAQVLALLAS